MESLLPFLGLNLWFEYPATVNNIARPSDDKFYDEMFEQYGKVRRFLPHLLSDINFKSAPAGKAATEFWN